MSTRKPSDLDEREAILHMQASGFFDHPDLNDPRDAAYIAHAANAYPRLIEALRCAVPLIARGIVESAYQDIAAGPQYADRVLERMEALLREMGEEGGAK